MLTKGDRVIDRRGHLFVIEDVVKLNSGDEERDYYRLVPCFDDEYPDDYVSFVPVSTSSQLIRKILNKKEADELILSIKDIDSFGEISPRERKKFFEEVMLKGDRYQICRIIKTLYEYKEEKEKLNKRLTDYETHLLLDLNKIFIQELSLALNLEIKSVPDYVQDKIKIRFFNWSGPIAQLDRVPDFESEGLVFESP